MRKIILTLVLIAGFFVVTQAQTRIINPQRKFNHKKYKIQMFERRQSAELRRIRRRNKTRKQLPATEIQKEQENVYKENAEQAA